VPGPRRVVIDANVWISALLSPSGAPAGVLRAVLGGQLADTAGALLVTGDADLLDADLDPPALTPRALLDLL